MKSKTKCRVYRSYMRTRGVAVSDYFYKELPCLVFQIVQDLWYEFNINHWLLCDSFELQRISKKNVSLTIQKYRDTTWSVKVVWI